ncbi:hypothetical protein POM88_003264 [Heracleum sosnowskyi]|uniref:FHA domain-containing protein n=1 Tax=Heracleum sosnowskyi TaxID=360622 RepID=A0AAD8JG70_9APIA|nr:hypothetical protein POM88_003264 [Heracleum sosnowskyi]
MGDHKEEEKKVPVFTVFKKNSILKNIFLDAPQTNEPINSTTYQEDDEQVISIGRHPDCSITLDHPSISRLHLRLHSKPSSLTLSLVDLSSVHGTWVSGKKVEPGVQVDLNEGDIVQLGGSSRRYMLHWVPMSRAYNSDVPFVPPMDVLMTVKEGEELSNQDENCCSSIERNQIQSQCASVGDLALSVSKKDMTVSPVAPTLPEFGDSSRDNEEAKKGNLSREKSKQNEISVISSGQPLKEELIEEIKNQHSDKDSENSLNASSSSNNQDKDLFREDHAGYSSGTPLKQGELIVEIKNQHSDKDWENSPNASSPGNDHNKDLFREDHEENEISGFSSGTPLKQGELIEEIKNQDSDKDWENSPNARSPGNDHNKDLFREEHEEDEISGLSSGTPLKQGRLIEEIKNQHSDEDWEDSPNASSPGNDPNKDLFREEHEKNEISGFSSGTPLKQGELIEEIKNQHSDKDWENSPNARSPSNDHNKDLFREEHEENEISGFSSGTPLKERESIEKIKNRHSDKDSENSPMESSPSNDHNKDLFTEEHEEDEISDFTSGTPLKESAVTKFENHQTDKVNDENPQALAGLFTVMSYDKSPSGDHNKNLLREEYEENEISAFPSGQLLSDSVVEIEYDGEYENSQDLSEVISGIADAKRTPTIDHYEHPLRGEFEEIEIPAFSSGQLLSETVEEITYLQYDGEYERSQPAFSSGQLLSESVEEITYLQYDGEYEKSQPLNGVLSGIANANSSPAIDHYREEFEEHAISAFSSGQLLNESVLEVECQQYDEVCDKSQALDGVLSGIADASSSSTIYRNEQPWKEEFEKDEISAFTSVEIGNQQYEYEKDEISQALDGVLSGIADANSSSSIISHNEHPLKEKFEKDEICAFTSLHILSESVVEIGNQKYDEDEKDEISAFTSVQILNESVMEIGNQQFDEDIVKSHAADGVPSSVANSHSLCQNYHNKNLLEFFNSSSSNEDVEIICASRMDNEQEKMSTSSCYSPCSSTILERKDQLCLYEQDRDIQDVSSSGVYAIQSLRNTPSKSEQESHWQEIMGHSLSDVGKSFEALDNENSLKGQKEITVITRETEDCFGQLDEKNKTGQTFAINVSEPKDKDVNTPLRSGKQSDPPTIRGKPTSIDIQTGKWFPTDTETKELYEEHVDYGSASKALISDVEVFAEEIFTPDKENFGPNTHKQMSTKKTDELEEIKLSDPLCLSSPTKNSICWNFVQNDELLFSSDKENHTPKVLQKSRLVQPASKNSARLNLEPATKNGISRIPFKSLLSNSSSKSFSSYSGKYVQPIEKNAVAGDNKRWIMVADTNSLLNKVSRKALQLLQGVKGTQLIIPRVVIRELDCMKRRGYLFTRTTEISSALQWIEDCMINTKWWIHVESLMEEGRHLTPSPSPSLSTSEGEIDFPFSTLFPAFPKFLEIVSPTPGDHILECALLNRRMKNDENLVILSDDVSLKIKAMAEGIMCEAAEEFRESLVNPFSDRFLWAKSSPRGLTWSCADDTVLREKYYRGPFMKPPSISGESFKGLKLILV